MDKESNQPINATTQEIISAVAELLIHKEIITEQELVNKIKEKQQK
jgi:hypothetical protein